MLLHYSGAIERQGPLVHLWCMRYEAKHNFFVTMAEKVCNFENICKTLAVRHQESLILNKPIVDHIVEYGPIKKEVINSKIVSITIAKHLQLRENKHLQEIRYVNWCKKGIYYKCGFFICGGFVVFEEILEIFLHNQNFYFVTIKYDTIFYNKMCHAYAVEPTKIINNVRLDELKIKFSFEKKSDYTSDYMYSIKTYFILVNGNC